MACRFTSQYLRISKTFFQMNIKNPILPSGTNCNDRLSISTFALIFCCVACPQPDIEKIMDSKKNKFLKIVNCYIKWSQNLSNTLKVQYSFISISLLMEISQYVYLTQIFYKISFQAFLSPSNVIFLVGTSSLELSFYI